MSWGSLASNQMVSFTDAQSSGFPLNSGQSPITSDKCMTKNDILTLYTVSSEALVSYASNQLVPKFSWLSQDPLVFIPNINSGSITSLENNGFNFNETRNQSPIAEITHEHLVVGCSKTGPSTNVFAITRAFMGFNTSTIDSMTVGGIKVNINFNNESVITKQYCIVALSIQYPATHAWNANDFSLPTNSVTFNGNTIYSEIISINPGQTGDILFPFNAAGLAYVNGTNDATFALMEYFNDWKNLEPTPFASTIREIRGFRGEMKLYYQSPTPPIYTYQVSNIGHSSSNSACLASGETYSTYYSFSSSIVEGMVLYTEQGMINPFNGNNLYYKSGDTNSSFFINTVGVVTPITVCSVTAYTYFMGSGQDSETSACNIFSQEHTWYSDSNTLGYGVRFFTDNSLTTPVDGLNKWYKNFDANTSYLIDSDGYIINEQVC